MAIAFSNLGASANPDINSGTDASSYANSSWTPPTSGLIFVFVNSRNASGPATPTISGNSLTWTEIATVAGSVNRVTLFGADASGATTGATTIDFGAQTQLGCVALFCQATGVDLSGGVAAAFVQTKTGGPATATSGSITFTSAQSGADNRPIACFLHAEGEVTGPDPDWTEQDDVDGVGPARGCETQTRADAFDSTATASWATSVSWMGIAAELKATVTAINITPGAGSLGLSGTATSLALAVGLAAGSLGLTGTAPALAHVVPVPAGTIQLSGTGPTPAYQLDIAAGTIVFSGSVPVLADGLGIPAGALVLTGSASTLHPTLGVPAGGLTLAGATPSLAEAVPIAGGALTFAGTTPTLQQDHAQFPASGALVLAGTAPSLAWTLPVPAGALALSGAASGLADTLPIAAGALTLAGGTLDATVGYVVPAGALTLEGTSPSLAVSLAIGAGALTLSGTTPAVVQDQPEAIPAGSLTLTGTSVALAWGLEVPVGALALTGAAPSLAETLPIEAGTLTLTGQDVTVEQTHPAAPAAGSLSLSGIAPSLDLAVGIDTGAITLTGGDLIPDIGILMPVGALTLASDALTPDHGLPIPAGALTLTGSEPVVINAFYIFPTTGTLAFTSDEYALDTGILMPAGALALTGEMPALSTGIGRAPAAGSLTLTGNAFALAWTITAPAGTLTLTGSIPTAQMGPLTGSLTLTGTRPEITIGLFKVEFQLNGIWTTVTDDVLGRVPFQIRYGISGNGPLDRVSDTGTCSFALRNDPANSVGLRGAYSPEHANVRAGFAYGTPVRVTFAQDGAIYRKFLGKIVSIRPEPGQFEGQATHIVAHDWMEEAATFDAMSIALQTNKRSDQVISTIVAAMDEQPAATDYDVGGDTYTHALHNLGGGSRVSATELFQDICQSELGYLMLVGDTSLGGKLTFQNRTARAGQASLATFTDSTLVDLGLPSSLDQIYNEIIVRTHPKRVDTANVVLFSLEGEPLVAAGATLTIVGAYRDPAQEAVSVGGKTMVAPVATTDYLMNSAQDGSGTNLTANFTVVATFYATTVEFVITNTGGTPGYITFLRCRGLGVYDYAPIISRSENAASQTSYGRRTLDVDMPFQESTAEGIEAADYLVNIYRQLENQFEHIDFLASATDALLTQAIQREPGDRITVTETQTGVSGDAFIHMVELTITPKHWVRCRWLLAPAAV